MFVVLGEFIGIRLDGFIGLNCRIIDRFFGAVYFPLIFDGDAFFLRFNDGLKLVDRIEVITDGRNYQQHG